MLIVSAGKWVYEVLISSQGLMQIGWCTLNCHFNQEVHTLTHKQTNNAYRGTGKHQRTQTDTQTHTRAHENTHCGPHAHAHTNTRRHTHTQTHRGTHKHTEAQTNHTIFTHAISVIFYRTFDIPGGCRGHAGLLRLRREQSPQVERDDNQLWQGQERLNQRGIQHHMFALCVYECCEHHPGDLVLPSLYLLVFANECISALLFLRGKI